MGVRLVGHIKQTKFNRSVVQSKVHGQPVKLLIIGAGYAGALAAKEILADRAARWNLIGFIDDDVTKSGAILYGVPVFGGRNKIAEVVKRYEVEQILIAIPSLPRSELRSMTDALNDLKIPILIVPPFVRWMSTIDLFTQVRPVQVEDLLGRDPVPVDVQAVGGYLRDRTVLVTGAGGSIGSEISRQVAEIEPKNLILLGRGENSIFEINQELSKKFPQLRRTVIIGDIRDGKKMEAVFRDYAPDVVFHAAAHKHVPLMEDHPDEAFLNNVLGTDSLAALSEKYGVQRFILVSSDKAVRPTNVMGASKRVAEMTVQSRASSGSNTCFITVRFGNVLGSRGSVLRVFREQIANGGPVTITDPRMERYFMTIPEAVGLVVEAGAVGRTGEVLLFDMGEPVKIIDLADRMIRLSGFEPGVDIPIKITGIRPGEKLFEELSRDVDDVERIGHDRMWRVRCPVMPHQMLESKLDYLRKLYQDGHTQDLAQAIKDLAWWEAEEPEAELQLHVNSSANSMRVVSAKA